MARGVCDKTRLAGPEFVVSGGFVLSNSEQHIPSNDVPKFIPMEQPKEYNKWDKCYVDITRSVAFFDAIILENDSIFDPREDRVVPILEDEQIYMCRQMLPMLEDKVKELRKNENRVPLVLDVGTGGGVFAIWAAKHGCNVLAIDINPRALRTAVVNAERNLKEECVVEKISELLSIQEPQNRSFPRSSVGMQDKAAPTAAPANETLPAECPGRNEHYSSTPEGTIKNNADSEKKDADEKKDEKYEGKICFIRERFGDEFITNLKKNHKIDAMGLFDIVILTPPFNPTIEGLHPAQHASAGEDAQLCFKEQIKVVPYVLKDHGVCIGVQMSTVTEKDDAKFNLDAFEIIRKSFEDAHSDFSADYALVFAPHKGADLGILVNDFIKMSYINFTSQKENEQKLALTNKLKQYKEFGYIYYQIVKEIIKGDKTFFDTNKDKAFNRQVMQFTDEKHHIWEFRTLVHRNIVENVSTDNEFVPSYHIFNAGSLNANLRTAVSKKEQTEKENAVIEKAASGKNDKKGTETEVLDKRRKLVFDATDDFISEWNKSLVRLVDAYIRRHELCSVSGRNFNDRETFFDTIIINSAPYYKNLQGFSNLKAQYGFWMKCDCAPSADRVCRNPEDVRNYAAEIMNVWGAITPAFQKSGKAIYQHPRFTGLLSSEEQFMNFNISRFDYKECKETDNKGELSPDTFKRDPEAVEGDFENALSEVGSLCRDKAKTKHGEIIKLVDQIKLFRETLKKIPEDKKDEICEKTKDLERNKIELTLRTGELSDILKATFKDDISRSIKAYLDAAERLPYEYLYHQYYNYVKYFYHTYLKKKKEDAGQQENRCVTHCEQGQGPIHGFEYVSLDYREQIQKQYETYLSVLMEKIQNIDTKFQNDASNGGTVVTARTNKEHMIDIEYVVPGLQRHIPNKTTSYYQYISNKGIASVLYDIDKEKEGFRRGLEDIFELDLKLCHSVLHKIVDDTITDEMENYRCPKSIRSSAFIGVPLSFTKGAISDEKTQNITWGDLPPDYKGGVWVYVNSSNKWTPQMEQALMDLVKFLSVIHVDLFSASAIKKMKEVGENTFKQNFSHRTSGSIYRLNKAIASIVHKANQSKPENAFEVPVEIELLNASVALATETLPKWPTVQKIAKRNNRKYEIDEKTIKYLVDKVAHYDADYKYEKKPYLSEDYLLTPIIQSEIYPHIYINGTTCVEDENDFLYLISCLHIVLAEAYEHSMRFNASTSVVENNIRKYSNSNLDVFLTNRNITIKNKYICPLIRKEAFFEGNQFNEMRTVNEIYNKKYKNAKWTYSYPIFDKESIKCGDYWIVEFKNLIDGEGSNE